FTVRQAFVMTTLSWIAITVFAALPFAFSELDLSVTDAFFEAMSGITTTGATVIVNLDNAPPGILLWRALLQWLGGIGIIVTAVAMLPMLKVGGMQLFRMESSDTTEKVLPRAAQISTAIGAIYFILTSICAVAYWAAGMPGFDAIAHAMTTIATGGFSTSDDSLAAFATPGIEWIAVVFMILGSLPFVLYLQVVRGRPMSLFRDSQVRWFLALALALIIIVILILSISQGVSSSQSLRLAAFNTISILTGTGYSTAAFDNWGPLALTIFFLIMFIGGCAGSTTCGIKIFRFQILYETATTQIRRLVQPHGVFIPYYNRSPITDEVAMSVMSFFFFYVLVYVVLALGLSLLGLDFLTALSGAATAISNVGPGLGPVIGPNGTFTSLPDSAKWLLSAGMLLGRLELFTILVLFAPAFWKP
ncbi:MAG: TrkH family potassium uptake protein, partial [Alphaproteobacteria bacterium]